MAAGSKRKGVDLIGVIEGDGWGHGPRRRQTPGTRLRPHSANEAVNMKDRLGMVQYIGVFVTGV